MEMQITGLFLQDYKVALKSDTSPFGPCTLLCALQSDRYFAVAIHMPKILAK